LLLWNILRTSSSRVFEVYRRILRWGGTRLAAESPDSHNTSTVWLIRGTHIPSVNKHFTHPPCHQLTVEEDLSYTAHGEQFLVPDSSATDKTDARVTGISLSSREVCWMQMAPLDPVSPGGGGSLLIRSHTQGSHPWILLYHRACAPGLAMKVLYEHIHPDKSKDSHCTQASHTPARWNSPCLRCSSTC
jgi:hypothetical protein